MIKWGIIGCGSVTEVKSGPAFYQTPGSELVAVMRRDGEKAAAYAKRHNVATWYNSVDLLLADNQVEAVYIATPPSSHAELTLRALRSGRPVYVEKPMATTYADSLAMIAAAESHGVPLFVAYYRRAMPYFQRVKKLIESGAIGVVERVSSRIATPPSALPSVETDWHVRPEISGGGHFVDLAPHQIDLLLHWFGTVAKQTQQVENRSARYAAEDYVSLSLHFQSGVSYTGEWDFSCEQEREDSFIIEGTKGRIRFSTFSMTPISVEAGGVVAEIPYEKPATVQHDLIGEVVEALRAGLTTPPQATYEAAEVTRIAENTLKAYYEKR